MARTHTVSVPGTHIIESSDNSAHGKRLGRVTGWAGLPVGQGYRLSRVTGGWAGLPAVGQGYRLGRVTGWAGLPVGQGYRRLGRVTSWAGLLVDTMRAEEKGSDMKLGDALHLMCAFCHAQHRCSHRRRQRTLLARGMAARLHCVLR